jgi:formylglycine-generating enzyme required for sulfatase activity
VVVAEPGGFEMVLVEAGGFEMGSASGSANEQPVHTVQITRSFYVSKYEVTFDQYDEFCADADSPRRDDHGFGRGSRPAIANWYNAVAYCNWQSERAGLTPCYKLARLATECDFSANGYRLPTEAEWEYAARGGPRSEGYIHAGSDNVDDVAWYGENSGGQTQPVGQKQPNELGLYDMSGNLWDWCWDWYGRDYYASSPASDPTGPPRGSGYMGQQKVLRGGNYLGEPSELRVTRRGFDGPDYEVEGSAIRVVRTV